MKRVNKPRPAIRPHKTKEDFLRWLKKREGLKKQVAPVQSVTPEQPASPRPH